MVVSESVNNVLIQVDKICDYIPIVSTVTNLVDIFEKYVLNLCYDHNTTVLSPYFSHISKKDELRCVILLVPILGNLIVAFFDYAGKYQEEINKREYQNDEVKELGLNLEGLPEDFDERQQIINEERVRQLEQQHKNTIPELEQSVDQRIVRMQDYKKHLETIIADPTVRLFRKDIVGVLWEIGGTHKDRINEVWGDLVLLFIYNHLFILDIFNMRLNLIETFRKKCENLIELKKESMRLRQEWYRDHVQSMTSEELLHEAKEYYLKSFIAGEEQEEIKTAVEQMTVSTILPKLKQRVFDLIDRDYKCVEMEELISRMEQR